MNADNSVGNVQSDLDIEKDSLSTAIDHGKSNLNVEKLTYDKLWETIEKTYREKQTGDSIAVLSGKDELKIIMDSASDSLSNQGEIEELDGSNCSAISESDETFCGFLKLRKQGKEYKLKIAYNNKQGRVTVVKKDGENVSYYKKDEGRGIPKAAEVVNFDQLKPFGNKTDFLWKEISYESFIK